MTRKREPAMPFQRGFPGRLSVMNMTIGSLSREIKGLDLNVLRKNNIDRVGTEA
jgi:hypothetical protein